MNCAKCLNPNWTGRPAKGFKLVGNVRLLLVGQTADEEKFQCPNCRSIFWFPKDTTAQQITFNQSLAVA